MKNKWHDEILSGRRYPVHWIVFLIFFNGFHTLSPVWAARAYKPEIADPVRESWRWRFVPQLSSKGIRCMAEDRNGLMWFGTNEGVSSYDGLTWKRYARENGLPGGFVQGLFAARDTSVYASTNRGIVRFSRGKWDTVIAFEFEYPDQWKLNRIFEALDGSIWAGLRYGALRLKNHTLSFYTTRSLLNVVKKTYPGIRPILLPDAVPFDQIQFDVYDIFEKDNGDILFAIHGRDILLQHHLNQSDPDDPKAWEVIRNKGIRSRMFRTRDGRIWILTDNQDDLENAPWMQDPQSGAWKQIDFQSFGGTHLLFSMAETHDGTVLFGGLEKIVVLRDNRFSVFESRETPASAFRRPLLTVASDKTLWIAEYQGDVYRLDLSYDRWITYRGLNFQCDSKDGRKWYISTDDGVVCQDGQSWIRYGTEDGLMDAPQGLMTTRKGQVWAAGGHAGHAATAFFNGKKWTLQIHRNLSWAIDYRSLFEASDGSLWFGAYVDCITKRGDIGGAMKYDPQNGSWSHVKPPAVNDGIYGFAQTPDGYIWNIRRQVIRFDGRGPVVLSEPMELASNPSDCIQSTKNGHVWIGSRSYGVFHFNPYGKAWNKYDEEKGLPGNSVISISCTSDTTVWAATENGIGYFDGCTWTNQIFPPQTAMDAEGGSIKQSSDGAVWINKTTRAWHRRHQPGIASPKSNTADYWTICYRPDSMAPETRITTSVKKVSQPGNTVMTWEGVDAWDKTPQERLQYSYRVDGGAWSAFSQNTNHVFLALKSGEHKMEVRSRDTDFNVDPTPAEIKFSVLPPIWRHPVVILLVLLSLGIATVLEIRILNKNVQLRKVNSALEEKGRALAESNKNLEQSNRELDQSNTELEQAQNLLTNANLNLQRSNTELEQFAYVASHDLQEPLRMVTGYMSLLSKRYQEKLGEDAKEFIGFAVDGAKRMQQLITDLLSYSRVSTQGKPLVLTGSEDVFTHVVQNLKVAIEESGAKVTHDPLPTVKADGGQLDRLLQNLVGNAIKYRDKQTVPEVHVSAVRQDQEWIFSIRDNGIGIDQQFYEKIFGIFQRLHTREEYSGTGIGLAVCKKIVERHGGRIWVESEEGKGSNFKFTMPMD